MEGCKAWINEHGEGEVEEAGEEAGKGEGDDEQEDDECNEDSGEPLKKELYLGYNRLYGRLNNRLFGLLAAMHWAKRLNRTLVCVLPGSTKLRKRALHYTPTVLSCLHTNL